MPPRQTFDNTDDRAASQPIFSGEAMLCVLTAVESLADYKHLLFSKLCAGMLFAPYNTLGVSTRRVAISARKSLGMGIGTIPRTARLSALLVAVAHVIGCGAGENMDRVTARGIIAMMTGQHIFTGWWGGPCAERELPGDPRGGELAFADTERPVPAIVEATPPRPAFVGAASVNLDPEARGNRQRSPRLGMTITRAIALLTSFLRVGEGTPTVVAIVGILGRHNLDLLYRSGECRAGAICGSARLRVVRELYHSFGMGRG